MMGRLPIGMSDTLWSRGASPSAENLTKWPRRPVGSSFNGPRQDNRCEALEGSRVGPPALLLQQLVQRLGWVQGRFSFGPLKIAVPGRDGALKWVGPPNSPTLGQSDTAVDSRLGSMT